LVLSGVATNPSPGPEGPAGPPILEVVGLEKRFGSGTAALAGVTLRVDRPGVVAVLGPSGAGKSTLLRCINRLTMPTAGRVLVHGEDVTHASGAALRRLRRRVGMVFQQFNLVGRLSVFENVLAGRLGFNRGALSLPGSVVRVFSRSEKLAAMECLARVGIAELAGRRADSLSGGQQQRVAIARVLAQEPSVILADEPVASLDPANSDLVMRTLAQIAHGRGIAVVVNLHQMELAREHADRVVALRSGRLAFDGAASMLTEERVRELFSVVGPSPEPEPALA
jgi:phosphonate transport system ATP-binding protein